MASCIFLHYIAKYMTYKIHLGEIKMSIKNDNDININNVGNFIKNAVKNFENNITTQTDYIEKVERIRKEDKNSNNH